MISCPLISIILVNYNSGECLVDAIDSIRIQNYKDFEFIVIDGNSTDGSLDIIKTNKPFINQMLSEPDRGIYDAMNKGIKMAKGDWIYFLGADDQLFDEHILSKASSVLKSTKADVVYGNVLKTPSQVLYDGRFNAFKMIYRNVCHQAIFYKKSLFDRIGLFDTKYQINADWEFNFKALLSGTIKFEYVPLTIAYFNEEGASGSREDQAYEIRRKDFLTQLPLWAKVCFRYRKTRIVKLISKYFLNFKYA